VVKRYEVAGNGQGKIWNSAELRLLFSEDLCRHAIALCLASAYLLMSSVQLAPRPQILKVRL